MDFMSDALLSGRKFRVLNLLDDFTRGALAIERDVLDAYFFETLSQVRILAEEWMND
jgi:hypothetical protein